MDAVRNNVENLVQKELADANKKFPLFNSAHEGYAILLEEIDELKFEMLQIKKIRKDLWKCIKRNERENDCIMSHATTLECRAVFAAVEAIQVAAMCEKLRMSLRAGNSNVE